MLTWLAFFFFDGAGSSGVATPFPAGIWLLRMRRRLIEDD